MYPVALRIAEKSQRWSHQVDLKNCPSITEPIFPQEPITLRPTRQRPGRSTKRGRNGLPPGDRSTSFSPFGQKESQPLHLQFYRVLAGRRVKCGSRRIRAIDQWGDQLMLCVLEASPIVKPLLQLLAKSDGQWKGTSERTVEGNFTECRPAKRQPGWPRGARSLSCHLQRLAPCLRMAGWDISHARGGGRKNQRLWLIRRVENRITTTPKEPRIHHEKRIGGRKGRKGRK